MNDLEYEFLPEINPEESQENNSSYNEIIGDSQCPCCGYMTIPNKGDALAYVCPVCYWEIDLFINGDNEISDLNYGITLMEARYNYEVFGASHKKIKKYCRQSKDKERV
ncbi:CPCC family cysteine-rich protein [uncultured Clostridium sp.]|uniref:CPCC family cysteine-rich protein n=1 Tax=uncultured Clostridium sp. TaxID=59620 RepID=UPI002620F784|nr:CPCC family cysteine-rich protein [uncultured Clostridium sp.]